MQGEKGFNNSGLSDSGENKAQQDMFIRHILQDIFYNEYLKDTR